MDIVIDGVIFGLQKAGGISRVWAQLLTKLDQSPYSVAVLVPSQSNVEWQRLAGSFKRLHILKRRRFRWGKTSRWADSLYLTQMQMRLRPKIWHCSYYVGRPLIPTQLWVSYHDMIPEQTGCIDRYEQNLKKKIIFEADKIFAPSSSAKQDLLAYWPSLDPQKITPIAHGIDPELYNRAPSHAAKPYFIYVGKRGGYKNFDITVSEILKDPRFDPYTIVAIGGELKPTLLHPRITYLGTLGYQEVIDLMAKADCLLFPSEYEGFGIPLLEAFTLGVPVLAKKTSSLPEIAGDIYPLMDQNKCTDTLDYLLRDRDHWIAYGQKRAQLFTLDKCWSLYDAAYKQALTPAS
jgi:mannosyltransferase